MINHETTQAIIYPTRAEAVAMLGIAVLLILNLVSTISTAIDTPVCVPAIIKGID